MAYQIQNPSNNWQHGYNARMSGVASRDNPHPENSSEARGWQAGWWAAYMAYVDEQQIRHVGL